MQTVEPAAKRASLRTQRLPAQMFRAEERVEPAEPVASALVVESEEPVELVEAVGSVECTRLLSW